MRTSPANNAASQLLTELLTTLPDTRAVEALNGTLRAAKRQKKVNLRRRKEALCPPSITIRSIHVTVPLTRMPVRSRISLRISQVTFEGELLMMPKDKDTLVVLLEDSADSVDKKADATLP